MLFGAVSHFITVMYVNQSDSLMHYYKSKQTKQNEYQTPIVQINHSVQDTS